MTENGQTANSQQPPATGQNGPETVSEAERIAKQEEEAHAAACRCALEKARVAATRDKMKVDELRMACRAAILSDEGNRDVLIERLGGPKGKSQQPKPKKFITRKWVEGKTVCAVCHDKVRVTKVETGTDTEGRVVRTRTLQCNGKHRHTYKLAEITSPDA